MSLSKAVAEDPSSPWTSIERQDLMRLYYPELVNAYEESIKKPVKEKKTRGRKKEDVGDVTSDVNKPKKKRNMKVKHKIDNNQSQNSTLVNVSVSVNKLKRKLKVKKVQKTMDSFIANKRRKSNRNFNTTSKINSKTSPDSLSSDEVVKNSSKEKDNAYNADVDSNEENQENNHGLSMFNAIEKNNDDTIDTSNIVESILQKNVETKFAQFDNNIYKLVYDKNSTPVKTVKSACMNCSTPTESPIRRLSFKNITNVCNRSYDKVNESYKNIPNCSVSNTSYFFDKLTDDRDAFESSMDYMNKYIGSVKSINSTIDYSLPDIQL